MTGVAGPTGHGGKQSKEFTAAEPPERRLGVFLSAPANGPRRQHGGTPAATISRTGDSFSVLITGSRRISRSAWPPGKVWIDGQSHRQRPRVGQWQKDRGLRHVLPKRSGRAIDDVEGFIQERTAVARGQSLASASCRRRCFRRGNSYETRRSAIQGDARGDTEGGELSVLSAPATTSKKC